MKRLHLLIAGRVQGVFFRANTQKKARELGLTGFVRNLPDGQVETLAEGPEDHLKTFLAWCRQGPPSSQVTSVKTQWEKAPPKYPSFENT